MTHPYSHEHLRWTEEHTQTFYLFKEILQLQKNQKNENRTNAASDFSMKMYKILKITMGKQSAMFDSTNAATGLKPIIRYLGGKSRELNTIVSHMPSYDRYIEPFVGGGSVFMGIRANQHLINDLSTELISLYRYIGTSDVEFFKYCDVIETAWEKGRTFVNINLKTLTNIFHRYESGDIPLEIFRDEVCLFCNDKQQDLFDIVGELAINQSVLLKELEESLVRTAKKIVRISEENLETAVKSCVYSYFRYMFNDDTIKRTKPSLHTALFLFVRNYSYCGMERYTADGKFNISYGGKSYNSKSLKSKIEYLKSQRVRTHFKNTTVFNLDFEEFLNLVNPRKDDFIFLDPPYDDTFSTYDRNVFGKYDHSRLADYLINTCNAKWMMVIKRTDFIYNLYNRQGINIISYDHKYGINIKNRNEREVTHLLITNYPLEVEQSTDKHPDMMAA